MRRAMKVAVLSFVVAAGLAGAVLAGFSGTDLFLPMVGRQAGIHPSNWYTKIWIHNPGLEPVTVRLYLLERGTSNPAPPWADVAVGAGETEVIDNVVETVFHVQVMGAMRVTCPAKVVVTSRVYSLAAGLSAEDSVGQDFVGTPAAFAIGLNERTQVLGAYQTAPSADSSFRYNFGFVETTGHAATVRVRAIDAFGAEQDSKDIQVLAWSQRQVAFKDQFPSVSTENSRLELEVISGSGKVIAYGSAIANGSQDPTTFEMTYDDTLLAGGTLTGVTAGLGLTGGGAAGTVTLDVGAGDGIIVQADSLGIADRGVTPAKIAPAAVAGKVLGTLPAISEAGGESVAALPSNSVAWVDDGLKLPYFGSDASAVGTDIFTLTNLGAGRALHAVSGADTAIWAQSSGGIASVDARNTTGNGVSASTTSGTGVYATSSSGRGLWGRSATGLSAVYGEHTGNGDGINGSAAGAGHGVRGTTNSAASAGVFGVNGGAGVGVKGQSLEGTGVYGVSGISDPTGGKGGVLGENLGDGTGVLGKSATGNGVWAINYSNDMAALSATNNGGADIIDGWRGSFNRVFRVANDGQVWADGAYHSSGADFAELLPADAGLEPGDVLVIGDDGRLVRSSEAYQRSVAGVFSTAPGYIGGSVDGAPAGEKVPLAIVGIVPVKASAENGPIRPGDLLVASATPGHAMRAGPQPPAGTVIGKALDGLGSGSAAISVLVFLR